MNQMKNYIKLSVLFLLVIFIASCEKDKTLPENETPGNELPNDTLNNNGTPFANVPETEDIIMYEVNLRAFSQSGDLQGVIARLDNLKALHVNVIWLMPIHPIGQINSVNSPYSVKDYKAISAEYGTIEDLKQLTDEAHARDMAVMMDWVANHTAWDNQWISNTSWYTQDGNGNIVHPPGTNWLDVADLNFSNQEMRLAMIDAMKYWVLEANIDGYRCDYADGVPFDFWKQAFDSLNNIPDRKLIFLAEGTRSDHFEAGFHLDFGWNFYGTIKGVFTGQAAGNVFSANNAEYNGNPSGKHPLRFTTNHDESAWDATPMTLFNGKNGALAASAIAIFTGGVPMIYTGQEVGRINNVPFFSNSPINWTLNPDMLAAYEDMLGFYSGNDAARKGVNTIYQNNNVVCFKKNYQDEELLIVVNVRNNQINFALPAALQQTTWKDALDGGVVEFGTSLNLAAYEYLILKAE
jgi:glycosidase